MRILHPWWYTAKSHISIYFCRNNISCSMDCFPIFFFNFLVKNVSNIIWVFDFTIHSNTCESFWLHPKSQTRKTRPAAFILRHFHWFSEMIIVVEFLVDVLWWLAAVMADKWGNLLNILLPAEFIDTSHYTLGLTSTPNKIQNTKPLPQLNNNHLKIRLKISVVDLKISGPSWYLGLSSWMEDAQFWISQWINNKCWTVRLVCKHCQSYLFSQDNLSSLLPCCTLSCAEGHENNLFKCKTKPYNQNCWFVGWKVLKRAELNDKKSLVLKACVKFKMTWSE